MNHEFNQTQLHAFTQGFDLSEQAKNAALTLHLDPSEIAKIEEEVVSLTQELIRIPSVNFGEGKGDEIAVCQYVADRLNEVGIESETIITGDKRANLVAKIPGSNPSLPGLVVHGHIDVVPANAADWSIDPFAGIIKEGYVWGRGAVDMKDVDAMILAIVRSWQRTGYKPPRNILLVFFGDEEAGSEYGSHWLVANRPELFNGYTEAVSEVGGFSLTVADDKRLYLIEAAQKGIQWMKLTAKGDAGHGSFINRNNAITKLSHAIARIGEYSWPQVETKTGKIFWSTLAKVVGEKYDPNNHDALLKHLGGAGRMLGATIRNSANPTMLDAGYKANVIPGSASAVVDGRFLPAYEDQLASTIKELAGSDIEVEILVRDIALESDFSGPLVDSMIQAIATFDPEAIPVPYMMSGGTDNKALADLGIRGYGFGPLRLPQELDFFALFHGVDERIPIAGLLFGVHSMHHFLQNA
jgi:acetylornithine deacetylase/succinyl-diaminopimelate desuccinylase-like protein